MKVIARTRRALAITLAVMNLGSLRAVAVHDTCEHCRSFFAPSLTFKAIAKAATGQQWTPSAPKALGERCIHFDMHDLESNNRGRRVIAVAAASAMSTMIDIKAPRAGPLGRKLPTDESPVQHPHLLI
jgi:hypothetical protein